MPAQHYFMELNQIDAGVGDEIYLKEIQFKFESSKRYAIMGETGSGKTMLAKIMAGIEPLTNGSIIFQGEKLKNPLELLIPGHPKIAYLSQYFELPKNYYVKDYLDFENQIDEEQATNLKKLCRIEHLLNRKTQAMSGGEKQRVAMAKKLMLMPKLLILDEPFAHLDYANRQIMKSVIHDYIENYHANSILITHDATDVFEHTDELLILHQGRLVVSGKPKELYDRPNNIYVAQLLGPCMLLPVKEICFNLETDLKGDATLLLRPDFFEITNEVGDFSGIVKEIIFKGCIYIMSVEMPNHRQICLYHPHFYPPGSSVNVYFRRDRLHFIA